MTDQKMTRRDRRISAKKQQILESAMKVFLEKGFAKATINDIADAADMAGGTLYNYFESKEDLLIGVIDMMASSISEQSFSDNALQIDFREFMHNIVNQKQDFIAATSWVDFSMAILPALVGNLEIRERYNKKIFQPSIELFVEHLQKRVECGHLKPIENLPLILRLITGASFGMMFMLLLGDPIMLEAIADPEKFMESYMKTFYDQFIPDENPPA